ncbi:tRNA(Ile)-lysidine synthetase [Pararhizobium polonicum]|uniref:tRNA(Ile)-lysidine synthase n=1 Tax=Pararhizobium polonicum TaxID=1612624 RepID=A0A1C7P2A5_9HYPH|nr:tRNA lysidine(34) synthetase TilS [Pararhizobium polonicum]OBZ95391.1 tRNA(Ile)-lysidine synthetase [Pararhizobium polonicum]
MPAEADRAAPHVAVEAAKQFLSTFKTPGLILAAISGGSDSKGLLLALHEAIARGGFSAFSLAACTVDHALRSESADEARAVAALCAARGIPHTVCRWQGEKPATGIQAAARAARYRLLSDTALDIGASCIVTGHTADDQAETVAMRQGRSQPDAPGLAGMADGVLAHRRTWVLRPFLRLRRADIRDYLSACGEGWFDDPSNSNVSFERVRVRQALGGDIRPVEEGWMAAGEARLSSSVRVARLLAQQAHVFEGLVARLDPALAVNMADADCSRAILAVTAVIGGRPHLPGRETAARLAAFLADGNNGRMTAGRVVFDRRRSGLYLYREARDLPEMMIEPGQEAIWDGRFLVGNDGREPIVVHVGGETDELGARLIAAGLPEPVVKRAARSAPACSLPVSSTEHREALEPLAPKPRIESSIGLYDTFLPCFDLMMANSIAVLFGRDRYRAPPVHDVLTEKRAWA